MLVLFETAAGYAIFKLLDDKKLVKSESLYDDFSSPKAASKIVKLKHFEKFADITEALSATTAAVEGRISKTLKRALKNHVAEAQDQLLVADAKLGSAIKDKLSLQCVSNSHVQELMRCIRSQADSLLSGLSGKEMTAMALGLAHSLSRYKLKFNPDKVDTMIVQSVSLLDDLDKELNNYMMRCREWYGWHFPELGKLVPDNMAFIRTVQLIGSREHAATTDLSDVLPTEMEAAVKEAAEISMGTEISEDDIENILAWCKQVVVLSEYRTHLHDYLRSRMLAIAPNLSILVGELVGARLIAHAGSLMNLAKHPASTVQILGAEKALFRALKTKRDTPKYGLIYHSSLIGQASVKNKGRMSRMLAAKAALATRVDALGDESVPELGAGHKAKLEARLRVLEEGSVRRLSGTGKVQAKFEKYHGKSEVKQYPIALDSTVQTKKRKHSEGGDEVVDVKKIKKEEEIKKEEDANGSMDVGVTPDKKKKKKKDKDTTLESAEPVEAPTEEGSAKKKKKKNKDTTLDSSAVEEPVTPVSEKKKKKKKKSEGGDETLDTSAVATSPEDTPAKKKKKKSNDTTAELVELMEEAGGSEKKKKKKKKGDGDETLDTSAAVSSPEQSSAKKKKKKQSL